MINFQNSAYGIIKHCSIKQSDATLRIIRTAKSSLPSSDTKRKTRNGRFDSDFDLI